MGFLSLFTIAVGCGWVVVAVVTDGCLVVDLSLDHGEPHVALERTSSP